MKALATSFATQNKLEPKTNARGRPIGSPDSLRILVTSLGNILCGFDTDLISFIFESDHSLFIDTSPVVGKLHGCSLHTLGLLAQFAAQPGNYGPPKQWTQFDVEAIGVVMAGKLSLNMSQQYSNQVNTKYSFFFLI